MNTHTNTICKSISPLVTLWLLCQFALRLWCQVLLLLSFTLAYMLTMYLCTHFLLVAALPTLFNVTYVEANTPTECFKVSQPGAVRTSYNIEEDKSIQELVSCREKQRKWWSILRSSKKTSPNNMVTLYMNRREFVDTVTAVEPIDGIVVLDDEYVRQNRKIFVQLICNFRYGREDDEMIGLRFQKELTLVSQQIYPEQKTDINMTKMQERLVKKLGTNAFPFIMDMPPSSPASIVLQQKANDDSQPCGVQYFVKIFTGETECDRSHRRSTVNLGIRKVQYAPTKQGIQPCTVVRKDFLLSPGELELEVTLDKQLYHHGERVAINVCVRNNSNKVVKKLKAMVQQGVDVVLFQNGQFRNTIAFMETSEGCPLNPGSSLQKVFYLSPNLAANCDRAGIAVEGDVKHKSTSLASTTIMANQDARDAFGIIVSYAVKVKLFLGALGGELCAELPFILMHPKPTRKAVEAESEVA